MISIASSHSQKESEKAFFGFDGLVLVLTKTKTKKVNASIVLRGVAWAEPQKQQKSDSLYWQVSQIIGNKKKCDDGEHLAGLFTMKFQNYKTGLLMQSIYTFEETGL